MIWREQLFATGGGNVLLKEIIERKSTSEVAEGVQGCGGVVEDLRGVCGRHVSLDALDHLRGYWMRNLRWESS
jgi:hypothetical protein